ncbi:hypothetical protein FRB94_003905 [Tulasnella sp. JGI-2019a]|nr:hypothetical protein FRB93_009231 [Tulasnella sp. JGI-2019a]KAG9013073.1 hypothetical protein FRB94_003905 [Tulasnella sp. JGI-2019a]KAG9025713.1 hypothetical protein FRB95_009828 [Tulasnella sp. JGI-2019a]
MASQETSVTPVDQETTVNIAQSSSSVGVDTPSSSGAPPAEPAPIIEYKVWNPPGSGVATPGSLPDEYFQPTGEELKAAWQAQSRLVEKLNNAPLKTQAIRDKEAKEKAKRWPETTIRIKFPNQMMLERKFTSSETIKSVYAFVRNALTEEAKQDKFVLYDSPPRRDLKVSDPEVKTKTLTQLNLAPSSILHFSFLDETLNSHTTPPPLLPSILACAADLPPPPSFDAPPKKADNRPQTLAGGPVAGSSSGEKKMPKWLKLGKK